MQELPTFEKLTPHELCGKSAFIIDETKQEYAVPLEVVQEVGICPMTLQIPLFNNLSQLLANNGEGMHFTLPSDSNASAILIEFATQCALYKELCTTTPSGGQTITEMDEVGTLRHNHLGNPTRQTIGILSTN